MAAGKQYNDLHQWVGETGVSKTNEMWNLNLQLCNLNYYMVD